MKAIIAVCVSCTILIAIVVYMIMYSHKNEDIPAEEAQHAESLIKNDTLASLDREASSDIHTLRLADDMTPPTNKWYSGMVLTQEAQPGFNMPNSILPRPNGFELGLPNITSNAEGIYGPHVNGIQVIATSAKLYKLTRYDELTLTLTYYNASNQPLYDVTFAAGSPYAFVSAKQKVDITLSSGKMQAQSGGLTTFQNGGSWYGAKASNGETGQTILLTKGDELAVFSARERSDITRLEKLAMHPIQAGKVSYKVTDSNIETTLSYQTKDGKPTLVVRMPHQQNGKSERAFMGYPSLYGDLNGYEANTIEYSQPLQSVKWSLSLDEISPSEKEALKTQLQSDISATKLDKDDTYFGGKQLQRLAQLVIVADAIGDTEQRNAALAKLKPELEAWFDNDNKRSFYYDPEARAIVGRKASFGSDKELNDHHFHYGYFIYAASVVAKFDANFLKEYRDEIDLLVADIANYNLNESLPPRRNFDAYAGHSWASGFADYMDGNNQESSGEAVNAWTAVGLWAEVTSNKALEDEAAWLLANEVVTAKSYWLNEPNKNSYTAPLVSINWGGKREYKTFFSDEANAKLAIQLLPLNPTMNSYVANLPKSIFRGTDVNKQYGDYIMMAQNNKNAFETVRTYPDSLIDNGNSKAYMMAYVLSR